MEQKFSNETDPAKRQIIRDFAIMREEKEKTCALLLRMPIKMPRDLYVWRVSS